MVGGTWLVVPRPWSCGSTLGIGLERSFTQIAANGSSEFETNLRKERQMEGVRKAKELGVYKGSGADLNHRHEDFQ